MNTHCTYYNEYQMYINNGNELPKKHAIKYTGFMNVKK